jgi:hypothetical protein
MNLLMVLVVGASGCLGALGVTIGIAKLRKKDWKSALRGPSLSITMGVTVAAAASAMRSGSPTKGADEFRRQIETDPAYIALVASDPKAKETLNNLTQEGMRRMSPPEIRATADFFSKMAATNPSVCSAMWPPTADPAAVASGVQKIPAADRDAFMSLVTTATLRGLHHDGELRTKPSDPNDVAALFLAASDVLPAAEHSRLRSLTLEGAKTPVDACDGTKLLFSAIQKLPDEGAARLWVVML